MHTKNTRGWKELRSLFVKSLAKTLIEGLYKPFHDGEGRLQDANFEGRMRCSTPFSLANA